MKWDEMNINNDHNGDRDDFNGGHVDDRGHDDYKGHGDRGQ